MPLDRDLEKLCGAILRTHRERKFCIKVQQKLDRAIESYVRRYYTNWSPEMPEAERAKCNKQVATMIKAARSGELNNLHLSFLILDNDKARSLFDVRRKECELELEKLAKLLPVYPWVASVKGFGALGLATIVAETTSPNAPLSLSSYRKGLDGVYSRLGLAPYGDPDLDHNNHAGSTWKRESWRPRALRSEEWQAHPYNGERYANLFVIIDSLLRQQLVGKAKSDDGTTQPKGPYGEVYCARRAHTATTHPNWSDMHAKMDAMRVTMKALIKDLWVEWHKALRAPVPLAA